MGRWLDEVRATAARAEKTPMRLKRELTEPTKPSSVSFVSSDFREIASFSGAAIRRPTLEEDAGRAGNPVSEMATRSEWVLAGNLSACSSGKPAEAHSGLAPCASAPVHSGGGAAGETPPKLSNTLKGGVPATTTNDNISGGPEASAMIRDKYEERAAILEYDANLPRAWAEHFARLELDGPPGDFSPTRWQAALDGALAFLDQWGAEAHRLGWDVSEVFGLHPTAPAARVDCRGLAWLLGDGSHVVAMDRSGAEIRKSGGGRQRFYRVPSRPPS